MSCDTGCTCEKPEDGEEIFCKRHGIWKGLAFWTRCCERENWWRAWEEKRGPRQPQAGRGAVTRSPRTIAPGLTPDELTEAAERLSAEVNDPSIITKAKHYRKALARWAKSGFKCRTAEEVARIYAKHCRPCEKRDLVADACRICGCSVRTKGMALFNKLAMRSEKCPKGKWS